jgi:hypothetical protein
MSNFFSSVKADLLDRRLLPILALLGVALVAALAYAALGGGSSAAPATSSAPVAPATKATGIAVSQANTGTDQPVAETTNGSAVQTGGATRDPFAPVPGARTASASSAGAAGSSGASSPGSTSSTSESSTSGSSTTGGSESSESNPSSGESSPSETKKTSQPAKPQTVYHVTVRFGTAAPGTPPQSAQLTSYENLTRQQPLPSAKQPLLVFRGVIAGGKSATFTLVGEAILRGSAKCLPSASQCQAIDLKPGQTEELEYIPLGGTAITYQLQLVSIAKKKATGAEARLAFKGESKTGLQLLRQTGLSALPGLRYSGAKGVLVFATHHAFAARAHVAAWGARF